MPVSADETREREVARAGEDPWESVIIVALNTGLRLGEMLALRWDDCDLLQQHLTVTRTDWKGHVGPPKSGRNRVVPLNARALQALRRQLQDGLFGP